MSHEARESASKEHAQSTQREGGGTGIKNSRPSLLAESSFEKNHALGSHCVAFPQVVDRFLQIKT